MNIIPQLNDHFARLEALARLEAVFEDTVEFGLTREQKVRLERVLERRAEGTTDEN